MDPLRLELGYGLLALIGDSGGPRLTDQIKALRRQLAADLGFIMPPVRIQDNIQLPANNYAIKVKEIEAGRGEISWRPPCHQFTRCRRNLVFDKAQGAQRSVPTQAPQ